MRRIAAIASICIVAAGMAGCVKTRKIPFAVTLQSAKGADSDVAGGAGEQSVQTWHASTHRVVVLFGYGYNDAAFVSRTVETLCAKYGAAEDGGLIIPLVFPDDFKKGKDSIASELPLFALEEDTQLIGMLLLGAGENTNYGVAHIQDKYGGERTFPVFSLFPQDDVLGTEATSDFVLDRMQETAVSGGEEENTQVFVPEIEGMINRSMEYFVSLSSMQYPDLPTAAFEWDDELPLHVMEIASPLPVSCYVDGETGLKSVNHFVVETVDKTNAAED